MNMGVAKLREKVKQQQQKVEKTVRESLEKNQEYLLKNVKGMTDNVRTSSAPDHANCSFPSHSGLAPAMV